MFIGLQKTQIVQKSCRNYFGVCMVDDSFKRLSHSESVLSKPWSMHASKNVSIGDGRFPNEVAPLTCN